ncbi:hypothetical protein Tco_1479567 [Tanacetum coccineum]
MLSICCVADAFEQSVIGDICSLQSLADKLRLFASWLGKLLTLQPWRYNPSISVYIVVVVDGDFLCMLPLMVWSGFLVVKISFYDAFNLIEGDLVDNGDVAVVIGYVEQVAFDRKMYTAEIIRILVGQVIRFAAMAVHPSLFAEIVAVSLGHKVLGWRSILAYNFVIVRAFLFWVQDSLDEKCEVLLHPNGLSEDGTATL